MPLYGCLSICFLLLPEMICSLLLLLPCDDLRGLRVSVALNLCFWMILEHCCLECLEHCYLDVALNGLLRYLKLLPNDVILRAWNFCVLWLCLRLGIGEVLTASFLTFKIVVVFFGFLTLTGSVCLCYGFEDWFGYERMLVWWGYWWFWLWSWCLCWFSFVYQFFRLWF